MGTNSVAELLGVLSSLAFAIPAIKLLFLQRRISKAAAIATGGKSPQGRDLATDLRDQFKEGVFGFSWFDAGCVAIGVILLVVSAGMKL